MKVGKVMKKRKSITIKKPEESFIDMKRFIPSGSTMLNLCCSDSIKGAYQLGKLTTIPGASAVGKTVLALTCFAEMNKLKRFRDYDFIFDDVEEALEIDIAKMFNKDVKNRMIAPNYDDDGTPIYSNTIQDLKSNILTRIKQSNNPFVWILDSLDALTTSEELEKEYKIALRRSKNLTDEHVKEIKGSYKTEKAKIMGEVLRMIKGNLKKTNSALIIIQQDRAKIGTSFGKKTGTSGGKAPKFYSTHRIWLYRVRTLTDNGLKIGGEVKAEVSKNKITGKIRACKFNIYDNYGIDDVSSCIDYIIDQKHWSRSGNSFDAEEFRMKATKKKLIKYIESNNMEKELRNITQSVWDEAEEKVKIKRKRRY